MTVLETMLDPNFRQAFIERKKVGFGIGSSEIEALRGYVLSEECVEDIRAIMRGELVFSTPRLIKLRKANSTRRRLVYRYSDKEIYLMKLMAFALHKYDYLYSDSLYSFHLNKRVSGLFEQILKMPDRDKMYVLKCDIRDFGASIDPYLLIGVLKETISPEDEAVCRFICGLLEKGEYYVNGVLEKGSMGSLMGTPLSSFLGNIYLLTMDETMRNRGVFYCRYCDDVAVYVHSLEQARECQAIMEGMLEEKHLEFNTKKTQICPPGEPVELLGIQIDGDHIDISDYSLGKIKWKMTHKRNKLLKWTSQKKITKHDAMVSMIRYANRYFFGVRRYNRELNWVAWAFPVLTRDKSLKELDAHVQDCIRVAGSGKKTDAKYRVTYKMMKEHGYKNLVYAYYHGYEVMEEENETTNRNPESSGRKCSSGTGDDSCPA